MGRFLSKSSRKCQPKKSFTEPRSNSHAESAIDRHPTLHRGKEAPLPWRLPGNICNI